MAVCATESSPLNGLWDLYFAEGRGVARGVWQVAHPAVCLSGDPSAAVSQVRWDGVESVAFTFTRGAASFRVRLRCGADAGELEGEQWRVQPRQGVGYLPAEPLGDCLHFVLRRSATPVGGPCAPSPCWAPSSCSAARSAPLASRRPSRASSCGSASESTPGCYSDSADCAVSLSGSTVLGSAPRALPVGRH
eukprot:TRINITY_DN56055_c0_g1_i1.p1 TRINITY_DN56055_c0_g1~~TRINITY_DN56055_c0_g1_i1.p1  ORF type:complete len:221 (+),score=33.64 TRINITY_DN56055_c0_g1_i1:88-663(+)